MHVSGLEKRLANLRPMKPGQNRQTTKRERIEAKRLGYSRLDAARLKLAAQHYVDAETCRDPITRQRATRCGEYLLGKLTSPAARSSAGADQAAQALELLLNKPSEDGV
jgi:hypothetical protein